MKKHECILAAFVALIVTGILFYKTILYGLVLFPGDSLISEFKPWQNSPYFGYAAGAIPSKGQYPDVIRQLYPWRIETVKQWKEGQVPLWNPYNFSGTPLAANFQSAAFYPGNILFFIIPEIWAWTILIMLQFYLAFLFMFIYMRIIGLSIPAAALSSLTYGGSHFMIVWSGYNTIGHIVALLPAALYSVHSLSYKKISSSLMVIGTVFLMLVAGHPQVAAYAVAFIVVYTFVMVRSAIPTMVLFIVLGTGMAAIQLIPGIELILNAARSAHPWKDFTGSILLHPWHILMIAIPDLFGNPATRNYVLPDTYIGKVSSIGLTALITGLFARFSSHKKIAKFYMFTLITILLLTFNNPVAWIFYTLLPFLKGSAPNLMMFISSLALSVLAGLGYSSLEKNRFMSKTLLIPASFFIIVWISMVVISNFSNDMVLRKISDNIRIIGLSSIIFISSSLVILARKYIRTHTILSILLIIAFLEILYAFNKFNPFTPDKYVFPESFIVNRLKNTSGVRSWGYGTAAIPSNIHTYLRILSPEGYDPLYPRWYGEFIHSTKNKPFSIFSDTTRSDAFVENGFGPDNIRTNTDRKKILRSLGVSTILDRIENGTDETSFPQDQFVLDWQQDGWRVFTDTKAVPHVYMVSQYLKTSNIESFNTKFFKDDFDPLNQVILYNEPDPKPSSSEVKGSAIVQYYSADSILVKTESTASGILVISDTWYPGWIAFVDGIPKIILKANWTFRAIALPGGKHTVHLMYRPQSFRMGLFISLVSLFITGFLIIRYSKKGDRVD